MGLLCSKDSNVSQRKVLSPWVLKQGLPQTPKTLGEYSKATEKRIITSRLDIAFNTWQQNTRGSKLVKWVTLICIYGHDCVQAPRRSCCKIQSWDKEEIGIHIGTCQEGEYLIGKTSQSSSNSSVMYIHKIVVS